MGNRNVRLDRLIGVYGVGSGDWAWFEEYGNLINQPDTQKLLARIREEGIREPILLGTDGRVWDGHHRIVIAMHLGLDSVPVEFAGEGGALNALIAEKRAEWEAEQVETEWEYGTRCPMRECTEPHLLDEGEAPPQPEESLWRRTRERVIPAGPWEPVTNTESETEK